MHHPRQFLENPNPKTLQALLDALRHSRHWILGLAPLHLPVRSPPRGHAPPVLSSGGRTDQVDAMACSGRVKSWNDNKVALRGLRRVVFYGIHVVSVVY